MMDQGQKQVLTWAAVAGVAGLIIYKIGSKLGLFSSPVIAPIASGNTPTASQYTHTPGLNTGNIAKQIHDKFGWFGGDPFIEVFAIIKANIRTQGDWVSLNNSFNDLYQEDAFKYFQDLGGGLTPVPFWAEFSAAELQQITTYINNLQL